MYWDVNNLNAWLVEWLNGEQTSLVIMRNSYGTVMMTVRKDTYLKLMLSILKSYASYTVICHSYLKEKKLISVVNLCVICMTRKTM